MKGKFRILECLGAGLFLLAVLSCAGPGDGDGTGNGTGSEYSISVTSPAQNTQVAAPFSITGTKGSGVATVTISGGTAPKNASFAGDSWTVTFGTNEISQGIVGLTIQAKDPGGAITMTINFSIYVTNNGSGAANIELSGVLTGQYTSQWKAYAHSAGTNSFLLYGLMNSSNFTIPVPENSGTYYVCAYKDVNGNSVYDSGELLVVGTNVVTGFTGIAGLIVDIPHSLNAVVQGTVSNNTYGFRIGAAALDMSTGIWYWSAPSTAVNQNFNLSFPSLSNAQLMTVYYVDDNNNGEWDIDPVNSQYETYFPVGFANLNNLTNTVNIQLIGHAILGTVTGPDALMFDRFGVEVEMTGLSTYYNFGDVSAGSFTFLYYTEASGAFGNMDIAPPYVFIDANADGSRQSSEVSVPYTNSWIVPAATPSTNNILLVILKYNVIMMIDGGSASAYFKVSGGGGTLYASPHTWTKYKYDTPAPPYHMWYEYGYRIVRDVNGNDIYDAGEALLTPDFAVSNQSAVTNRFFIESTSVDVTVTGNVGGYTKPMLSIWLNVQVEYRDAVDQTGWTWYYNTNDIYSISVRGFDDLNSDGEQSIGEDSINSTSWSNPVASTNITITFP